jgi:hypothetical protein
VGGRPERDPLVCPACGAVDTPDSRFCRACGMPLVSTGEAPETTEQQERARKVRSSYAEGPLVKVAWARHQAEAELIAGMLLEEGIPSVVRRTGGFDVPDFLAAGPRDIFVAESGADAARELLSGHAGPAATPTPPSIRGVALVMLAIAGVCVVIGLALALLV